MIDLLTTEGRTNVQNLLNDALEIICDQRNNAKSLESTIDWYREKLIEANSRADKLRKELEELRQEAASHSEVNNESV